MIRCLPEISSCLPQNKRRQYGEFSSFRTKQKESDGADGKARTAKLNELSVEERSQVEYEMHGVADLDNETPELLAMKTEEMNEALARLVRAPNNRIDTSAFEKAVETSKDYVDRQKATFLRAERFNSREAATRLVRFFERKHGLFGQAKLVQEIRLDDFDAEEMNVFRKGAVMLLPQKDRAGRAILVVSGRVNELCSTKTMMRILFYVSCVAAQEFEGAQKSGIVIIYYGFGQTKTMKGRPIEFMLSWRSMPIRINACHTCADGGSVLAGAATQICAFAERLTVCRLRCHFGPQLECLYKLMTFGIPVNDAVPITPDGLIDLKYHHEMMTSWKNRETEQETCDVPVIKQADNDRIVTPKTSPSPPPTSEGQYVIPGSMDILLGKGRSPLSRPGALRLHDLVLEYRAEYEAATRFDKGVITLTILTELKAAGCRFLKSTPGGYEVCDESVAKEKVSKVFRNLRLKDSGKTTRDKKRQAEAAKRTK